MTWTAAVGGEVCGGCDVPFKANEPMALLTAKRLKRCGPCAGAPVDDAAVDAVLAGREAERAAQSATADIAFKGGAPVLPGFSQASDTAGGGLTALLKADGILGVRREPRLPAPRPSKPFSSVESTLPPTSDSIYD